jgi:hypothetical protein
MSESADYADAVKMSGYLMKKSTAGDWQKRYFETNGSFLTYYKSQKMSKLLAALSLPQVGDIRLTSESGDPFTFQLDLKDRQYILKAMNQEEADSWVKTLITLRDGISAPGAKKTGSPNSTQGKPDETAVPRSASMSLPKAQAVDPVSGVAWVKNDQKIDMDQCTSGCTIA